MKIENKIEYIKQYYLFVVKYLIQKKQKLKIYLKMKK